MAIALTVPERTGLVVASDLDVRILGECRYESPLARRLAPAAIHYVGKADRVLLDDRLSRAAEYGADVPLAQIPAFELAGRHDAAARAAASARAQLPPIVRVGNALLAADAVRVVHAYRGGRVVRVRGGSVGFREDSGALQPADASDSPLVYRSVGAIAMVIERRARKAGRAAGRRRGATTTGG